MAKKGDQPTLQDVARSAGVSAATVSRVLNNTAPVNVVTRSRILASLEELGYEHTIQSPSPKTDYRVIALLITDLLNPFFSEVARGVEEEISLDRYGLLLFDTSASSYRGEDVFNRLADFGVSGIIAAAARVPPGELLAFYEAHQVPMVTVNRRLNHPGIPAITIDFANATYRATQHLISQNHTRIGYLADYTGTEPSQARQRGIQRALQESGLDLRLDWCPSAVASAEGGFQAMSTLLSRDRADYPTAVITYNDIMALGALNAIRTYQLRVPEDISVVGFDGIAMATHANPPLTTIEQPKYNMGRVAMQTLKRLIDRQIVPGNGYTLMESPLVIRESTGPAPR